MPARRVDPHRSPDRTAWSLRRSARQWSGDHRSACSAPALGGGSIGLRAAVLKAPNKLGAGRKPPLTGISVSSAMAFDDAVFSDVISADWSSSAGDGGLRTYQQVVMQHAGQDARRAHGPQCRRRTLRSSGRKPYEFRSATADTRGSSGPSRLYPRRRRSAGMMAHNRGIANEAARRSADAAIDPGVRPAHGRPAIQRARGNGRLSFTTSRPVA